MNERLRSRDAAQTTRRRFLRSAALGTLGLAAKATRAGRILDEASCRPLDVAPFRTPYKYGKLVLEKSGVAGSFDANLVDCPFVFHANDRFYMIYLGHDGTGYQTGLAESADLIHWRKLGLIVGRVPASRFRRHNIGLTSILRDDEISSIAPLKTVKGRYLGTWHAYPDPGYEQGPAVIGLAWSDDFMHWEVGEPVLRPESSAAWEAGGLYKSYLVEAKGVYYLFYNAKNKTNLSEQTGVATSSDLKTWTRYAGNPIIHNGPKGSWDMHSASDPFVVRRGATWAVYYFGYSPSEGPWARDLLAVGCTPFHLTKTQEVMVDVGPPGSLDETYAHKPCVISWRGDLYHFYCAVRGTGAEEVRGISVARSRPWMHEAS